MKYLCLILLVLISNIALAQVPPIWQDYLDHYNTETPTSLLDFSYAGYHFSREEIPTVNDWTYFDVTDYGAVADDGQHDDEAIQAAIDAAEASSAPAVIFFPPGKFMVSEDNDTGKKITVSRDSIVFKGSGAGADGTEIFMDEMRVANGHWQFEFRPEETNNTSLTTITDSVSRGDFFIVVADASALSAGQTVHISHKSEEFARAHFGELELAPEWTRLFGNGGGMSVFEPHIIKKIEGNKVTFINPVQTDMPVLSRPFSLNALSTIEEIGIEDILFTSNWQDYPEDFVHHKDDIHDYGWSAIQFLQVKNGWIRNCEFRGWNENIDVRKSIGVTIENVLISGNKGHASFLTRRGYGLLVKDCIDEAGQHHGPGTGYSGVNTVYLRCSMIEDQSVDSHSGQPYATLLDDVEGGVFDRNGGPHESYPHHARDMVFWNFRHNARESESYNFWATNNRTGNTYADPIFVGFQSNNEVSFENEGLNQMPGANVEPRSLFEAQLALSKTAEQSLPEITFLAPGNGENFDKNSSISPQVSVSDPDGFVAYVSLYLNGDFVAKIQEPPYQWNTEGNLVKLNNLSPDTYLLEAEVVDNDSNRVSHNIEVLVGRKPSISIERPASTKIIEVNENVEVEVTASDSDGSIAAVELYLNDVLVSQLTEAPFIWGVDEAVDPSLFNLSAEPYSLKAVAVDDDGLTESDIQNFVVNIPPNVSFSLPNDGEIFVEGANVRVNIGANDSDGGISTVKLYLNGEFLSRDNNVPYTWGFTEEDDPALFNMAPGDYILRAEATDNIGSKRSDSISIRIESNEPLSNNDAFDKQISVHPNPFKDVLILHSEMKPKSIRLINSQGKTLVIPALESNAFNHIIRFEKPLERGLYFLHLQYPDERVVLKLLR